jgi:hypothetical protein
MQAGTKEIDELPAVIGVKGRLKELPRCVEAEGHARDWKLPDPS